MRRVLWMALATVLVCGGCSHVSSTGDAGPVECNLGEYSGDFEIETQSDIAAIAGYTSISGTLTINCSSCTDWNKLMCLTSVGDCLLIENNHLPNLDGLSALISVGWGLRIFNNSGISNLDGLGALTSVGEGLLIGLNYPLHDCEVCYLLDHLTITPINIVVHHNLDDTCTPVPAGCP